MVHPLILISTAFRKAYANLGLLRTMFPKVPIMALTASATETVVENIIDSLNLDPDYLFQVTHPFNRANLFYEVTSHFWFARSI